KHRRDMSRAEWAGFLQGIEKRERRAFGCQRAVDRKAFLALQPEHVCRRALLEEGSERAELGTLDGDAGRHAVAAALDDQSGIGRLAHQPAEIETGDRAS